VIQGLRLFAGALGIVACMVAGLAAVPAHAAEPETMRLGIEDCVQLAVRVSPTMAEALGRVHEFEARLHEVESVWYPKLAGTAFLAPAFTIRGSGFEREREIRWKSIRDWGPYTSLEMTLAQPIYSFGRAAAGAQAASHRAMVERARLDEAGQTVALEVRRLYYTRLYVLSLIPALSQAKDTVIQAQSRAQALFADGKGDVTQVDLAKLDYAASEVDRYLTQAQTGERIALSALKHTMGLPQTARLEQVETRLPAPSQEPIAPLATLLQQAATQRPQWAQLDHGQKAALKWEEAERLAVWPTVVLAGVFGAAWTPNHDRDTNNWHYDVYNKLVGGAALALKIDLDPALARAKAQVARAAGEQVDAMRRFAATGIPLQVRKAFETLEGLDGVIKATQTGMLATRRWMTFAASAYSSGTGEARDMLEGLASYVQARRNYLEAVQQHHTARAELRYAVGEPGL
jgi:outer membrane protein TolC